MISLRKIQNAFLVVCLIALISVLNSSCTTDEDPSITNVKLCESFPSGENECADDTSVISELSPEINISCELKNATSGDEASFTLFFDNDGQLEEVANFTDRLSGDSDNFKGSASFNYGSFDSWGVGSWEIKIELQSENPISTSKRFTTN